MSSEAAVLQHHSFESLHPFTIREEENLSFGFVVRVYNSSTETKVGALLGLCAENAIKPWLSFQTLRGADLRASRGESTADFELHMDSLAEASLIHTILRDTTLDGMPLTATLHNCVRNYSVSSPESPVQGKETSTALQYSVMIEKGTQEHAEIVGVLTTRSPTDAIREAKRLLHIQLFSVETVTPQKISSDEDLLVLLCPGKLPVIETAHQRKRLKSPEPAFPVRRTPRSPPPVPEQYERQPMRRRPISPPRPERHSSSR
ncbi:hypothetical protein XU18_2023 [Perkinsela sp. CCAP 1560/4]|nr:hypothetical protein XU18_2023 [Perkinsela sp. CCAP 1560/4]|eukprot:KNH07491.1 hypothetical protein XU18_2023 [Perkinsela sp. CCAP 1560/4]